MLNMPALNPRPRREKPANRKEALKALSGWMTWPSTVNSRNEKMAMPSAPGINIPSSTRPADQIPAITLPRPIPRIRLNSKGSLSVSL